MDRLIASNSVPLAQADTAPTTGTPQYATDGNPATNVAATLWPAYAFNALQDEVYNVIVGAGITPDRTKWNQMLLAIQTLIASTAPATIGSMRNLRCTNLAAAAGTSLTYTADSIVVGTTAGGQLSTISNLNATLNGATSGVINGLDTGALAANTSYAIYAALNPTTGAKGLIATLEPAGGAPTTYSGAHPIAGYTETALASVWMTNGSSQFVQGFQRDRHVTTASLASNTFTSALSNTSVTLNVPYSAWRVEMGLAQTTTSGATNYSCSFGSASPVNGGLVTANASMIATALEQFVQNVYIDILTPRTCFGTWVVTGGAGAQLVIAIAGYWF